MFLSVEKIEILHNLQELFTTIDLNQGKSLKVQVYHFCILNKTCTWFKDDVIIISIRLNRKYFI